MADQWIKYVCNFDRVLEEAIRTCVKNSLRNIFETLHGDMTAEPSPCLKLYVLLETKKVPNLRQLSVLKNT